MVMNLFKKNLTVGLICSSLFNTVIALGDTNMVERRIFRPIPETKYQLFGFMKDYITTISENWVMVAPDKHPEMLDFLATREQESHPVLLLPWAGEFYGKYLTSAVQIYRLTNVPALKKYLSKFVEKLISLQAEDGYLGVYEKSDRLTCRVSEEKYNVIAPQNWDLWGHYFGMMGLTLWYETTGDQQALAASCKIADLLCDKFLNKPGEMGSRMDFYTNLSPGHSLCLLYRVTGQQRYLDLAKQIVDVEYAKNVDYAANALAGKEYFENEISRWEALHGIMALAELYWLTGEEQYKQAFEKIWWSIAKFERFNHGAFSSGEEARGNPYDRLTKETCCTIAWSAMCIEMLKLTGNPIVADELELSLVNAIAGYELRDGYCHYHTPMDGRRSPPGGLTCCTANAPRGFGLLSDWALMQDDNGIVLNWYGPAKYETVVKGVPITIQVLSDYPRQGLVFIKTSAKKPVEYTLKLRIPNWSKQTCEIKVDGKAIKGVKAGSYFSVTEISKGEQTIELDLDMELYFWIGQKESAGRASIYRGPVLLALKRQNPEDYIDFDDTWRPYIGAGISTFASNGSGARFVYRFLGDEITWTGAQSSQGGKAIVKIDGKPVGQVQQTNEFAPFHCHSPVWKWSKTGLGKGSHEMEVVIGAKKESSQENWISVLEIVTPKEDPLFDLNKLNPKLLPKDSDDNAIVQVQVQDVNGRKIVLSDFDSAGEKLNPYISWLKIKDFPSADFSKQNPLRSVRPATD